MKTALLTLFCLVCVAGQAQLHTSLNTITPADEYDNIATHPLHSDSLSTSLIIWVKKEVAPHRHAYHSECLYVLAGTGNLKVGNQTYSIQAGDFVNIPVNTVHALSVTSSIPLKVISIQAPEFMGKDRIFE
jgi:mannose-6-phosphate isomerase-like protein (cupin superfamily)